MRTRLLVILAISLVLCVASYVAWFATGGDVSLFGMTPTATRPPTIQTFQTIQPPPERVMPATGYRDEAQWLASEVVAEMARWTALCGGPATGRVVPLGNECVAYRVEGIATDLRISHHIWSPADYLPVATRLLAAAPAAGATASDDGAALAGTLLTPITPELLARDRELSAQLQAAPADPLRHEQAALLCATLAFREAAGRYSDPRRELCAATAHLALARVRQAQAGTCGRIAEALIETLANRELAALAAAETLPADGPLAGWRQAVQVQATGDWRTYAVGGKADMIVQLAYCRALTMRLGDVAAVKWLKQATLVAAPDWGRLICEARFLSVQNGHVYAHGGLREEFGELALLWNEVHAQRKMTEDDLPAALALADAADAPPRVLGITRWSAFLSRQRAHRVFCEHSFLDDSWGVHDEAKQYREYCSAKLASDRLMPLVRTQFAPDPQRVDCARQAAELGHRHPELIPVRMWNYLREEGDLASAYALLPHAEDWWYTLAPPGTAYSVERRWPCLQDSAMRSMAAQVAKLDAIAVLAPYDAGIQRTLAEWRPLYDAASMVKTFGKLLDLDFSLNWTVIRNCRTSEERIAAYRRLVAIDPLWTIELANELADAKQDQEAVAMYERGYKECDDRIRVASSIGWLVMWYADHGNLPRAHEIADECYEVFSFDGISTKAKLDEHEGDYAEADKAWAALAERYDDQGPQCAFWLRTADKYPPGQQKFAAAKAKVFPDGWSTVTLAECHGQPPYGLVLTTESDTSVRYGVKLGHVIVAIDGVRCRTVEQLGFVRGLKAGQPLDLIVWDGKGYRQVVADVPNRRLGVNTVAWPSAQVSPP